MGQINDLGSTAFRDFAVEGLPASGAHEPIKSDVRAVYAVIDAALASLGVNGAITVKAAVKATLDGDLAHGANTLAIVYNDVAANNGIYAKVGTSGTGSWSKTALALPSSFADDLATVLASAEGVAAAAAQTAADLLAIQQLATGAPDAPSVLNKAFKDGSNVEAAAFRTALGLGNAALRNVGTTPGTVTAGDDARWEEKLDKATAATDGKFKFDTDSQEWSLADEFRQRVYLIRWKRSDNTWDDAFDLALAYVNTRGGGDIICPPLDIPLNRTVVIPYGRINIVGNGQGSTVFKALFSGDVFRFKAPAGSYLAASIRNCSIDYIGGSAATGGYAVVFDGVGDCRAVSVGFNRTYRGVGFVGNNRNCRALDCGGSDVVDAEFVINGGGNQHIQLGTTFDNTGVANVAFLVEETERVDLDFGTASHHARGLHIRPAEGKTVQNVFSNFGDYDATSECGILIEAVNSNSVVRNIFISGGSAGSASTKVGLDVRKSGTGQVGDIWVSNAMLQANLEDGCRLAAGRVHFVGVHVGNNGIVSGGCGIRLMAGLEFFQMTGGSSGQLLGGASKLDRPMLWQNHQSYGIVIDSGFDGEAVITGADLRGNLTGPIQNNSAVSVEANNCPGYRTRASGVATIPVGAAFVTVTPPALAQPITDDTVIVVSCLSNPDLSGVETVWRGGITGTSFDIVTSPFLNVSGQPLRVAWEVRA